MPDRSDHTEIARAYDRWSATYDTDANATRDLDAIVVRTAVPDPTDRQVLELGCGTGKNTAWLAERARRVVAMDFSAGMLDVARTRVPSERVTFVRADVRRPWSVRDASFDFVIGNLILEHVEDVAPVFAEAARVLRDGGRLFVCELHPLRQLRGGQAHFNDAASGATVYVPAHAHSVSEYVNGGIEAGLTLERVGEWRSDADAADLPRLFSVLFRKC